MATIHLDNYDKRIVELLQEDASISNVDLAKKIGMSNQSIMKRVWGKTDFRIGEVAKIKKTLDLTLEQTEEIFLIIEN